MDIGLEFDRTAGACAAIFSDKMHDYGATWAVFRLPSLIDQIWIKILRVRTLEETGVSQVGEGRADEFAGIFNYCVIALMRRRAGASLPCPDEIVLSPELAGQITPERALEAYRAETDALRALMLKKNADYGGAWRSMDLRSITDQIIVKLMRIRHILDNGERLLASEDIGSQLSDIANYSVFALLRLRGGADTEAHNA